MVIKKLAAILALHSGLELAKMYALVGANMAQKGRCIVNSSFDYEAQRVLVLLADRSVNYLGFDTTVPQVPSDALRSLVAMEMVKGWASSDDPLVTLTKAGEAEARKLRSAGVRPWPLGRNETKHLKNGSLLVMIRYPGDDDWTIDYVEHTWVVPGRRIPFESANPWYRGMQFSSVDEAVLHIEGAVPA